ncbi:MAG: inositol monophosphatase family protein [Miltoncostaeaceae bacterium]
MSDVDPTVLGPALAELAEGVACEAGALLLRHAERPASGLASKSTHTDLVSDADRASETLIVSRLREARPDDTIVAEEGTDHAGAEGAVRWLVDPLDGTINFLWGIPHWCVSMAAFDAAGALAGAVRDPNRDETFTAVRGRGSCLNGRPLTIAAGTELAEAMVGTGFNYSSQVRARQAARMAPLVPRARDIRRMGAAALDLSWVAAGRFDAFYERGVEPWDTAAGALVVREAGGATVDLHATDDMPAGIAAGGAELIEQVLGLVES